jgi:hypothetical protein
MQGMKMRTVGLVVVAGLALAACSHAEPADEARIDGAGKVEHIDGTARVRVRLTAQAARRLDVQTAPVQEVHSAAPGAAAAGGAPRTVIPFAAVLYEPDGAAFTYTNPEPLVYVRQPVKVDTVEGDRAFLSDGPAAGTLVVTVGGAELSGIETSGFEE